MHTSLKPFQRHIVSWAVQGGRRAVWADTGLGKTRMQLEWARLSSRTSLIAAPLAVCQQTVEEGVKLGLDVRYVRSSAEVDGPGLYITNHEMVGKIDPAPFGAVALDEASILKQSDGKTRSMLIRHFRDVPARTAWTATPGPNDPEELTNQAEFLGQMTRTNMLAAYFIHDQDGWRMKGHAMGPMIRWMSTWALAVRKPSDLGDSDEGYELPGLEIIPEIVNTSIAPAEGELFAATIGGVTGRSQVRKTSLIDRCDRAIELVFESFKLAGNPDKMAIWDGSPNTKKPDATNTRRTPSIGNAVSSKATEAELRKSEPLTTASTTSGTSTSGINEPRSSKRNTTGGGVKNTHRTPSTVNRSKLRGEASPLRSSASEPSESSGSPHGSMTTSSNSKMGDVPSATRQSETLQGDAMQSTTTTSPAKSGEYYAANATLESENSRTTRSSSAAPSNTCLTTLEPWVLWCGLNDEQDYLARHLGDLCFSVVGSMTPEQKVDLLNRWKSGERPILLTKPSIHGMGINMQHCARTAFVGLSDSYEAYYQCIRRFYRFGQHRVVHAHIILSELEQQIAQNVLHKERQSNRVIDAMIQQLKERAA